MSVHHSPFIMCLCWSALSALLITTGCDSGELNANAPERDAPAPGRSDMMRTDTPSTDQDIAEPDGMNVSDMDDPVITDDQGVSVDMSAPPVDTRAQGNTIRDQDSLFMCNGSPALEPGRLRRVEREQWRRNAGLRVNSSNPLSDIEEHDYSTYSEGEIMDVSLLGLYINELPTTGNEWASRSTGNQPGKLRTVEINDQLECFLSGNTPPEDECLDTYVRYLLERGVLFRPPTDGEVDRLTTLARQALELEAQGSSRQETAVQIVAAARLMTAGLFRAELGNGELDEHGRIALDDWELANALAYVLDKRAAGATGVYQKLSDGYSTKDDGGHLQEIRQAALDGTISDPAVIEALVRQHIGQINLDRKDWIMEDSTASQGEYVLGLGGRDFFREWLGYDLINDALPSKVGIAETSAAQDEAFVSAGYSDNIQGTKHSEGRFINQLDDVIARVVLGDDGMGGQDVLPRLMTTDLYYVPANYDYQQGRANTYKTVSRINAVYGIGEGDAQAVQHTREDRWRVMPAAQKRGGVLTHPAWLASHSGSFENGAAAVLRGRWLREKLLCQDVDDLPIGVDASLGDDTKELSARARIQGKTEQTQCYGCHVLMNPLGYPFEEFNHTGFTRIEDHGAPPDGSSTLRQMPDPALDGLQVQGAAELSAALGASPWVKRCFIRQSFRYYMGREEYMSDACTLSLMEAAYDERGSFVDMLVALLTSPAFTHRIDPGQEEMP